MRILFFIIMIGLCSCNQSSNHTKSINNRISDTTITKLSVGEKIQGDFNGDGQIEFAFAIKTKDGIGNPVEDGTPDDYSIKFSNENLKAIDVGCCDFRLINEGDLNNDGADDLSIFQAPMNGCTYEMKTYSFNNKSWKEIVKTFLVPTGCEFISDGELQKRIFKESNSIFYFETDPNDENGKLIKTQVIDK